MAKQTKYDYDKDLDILHIYNSDIDSGIKGGLTFGNFNIDIGDDGKILGIELEGASSLLHMSPEKLACLDKTALIIRKIGNILFLGFSVVKGVENSIIQINLPVEKECLAVSS
jgi:uncharacterized protein YuzE